MSPILNKRWKLGFKCALLVLFVLLLYLLQNTPHLFAIGDVRPLLLLPAAVSISMFEGAFIGALVSTGCGLCLDFAGEAPFGSYGFLFLVLGMFSGLLLEFLLRNEWFNCMALVFVGALVIVSIQFLFSYAIYDYEHVGRIFWRKHFWLILYTTAVSPFIHYIVRAIEKISPGITGRG